MKTVRMSRPRDIVTVLGVVGALTAFYFYRRNGGSLSKLWAKTADLLAINDTENPIRHAVDGAIATVTGAVSGSGSILGSAADAIEGGARKGRNAGATQQSATGSSLGKDSQVPGVH
jgi:hypothetical protein